MRNGADRPYVACLSAGVWSGDLFQEGGARCDKGDEGAAAAGVAADDEREGPAAKGWCPSPCRLSPSPDCRLHFSSLEDCFLLLVESRAILGMMQYPMGWPPRCWKDACCVSIPWPRHDDLRVLLSFQFCALRCSPVFLLSVLMCCCVVLLMA